MKTARKDETIARILPFVAAPERFYGNQEAGRFRENERTRGLHQARRGRPEGMRDGGTLAAPGHRAAMMPDCAANRPPK
jgi:hypothetical protein